MLISSECIDVLMGWMEDKMVISANVLKVWMEDKMLISVRMYLYIKGWDGG